MTVGQRFKKIRQSLNLSQDDFGKKLGVTSQGISNIENCKAFLTLEKLQALKKFNVNLNFLIYGTGQMFNPPEYEDIEDEISKKVDAALKRHGLI